MTFGAPQWLWGLLLVPLLIALFIRSEQRGLKRLQEFVSARLLPQLAGTVNRPRRIVRFALQLLGLALAIVSLAQPRWGYTFEDVKRKGLDLLIAVDTSRSMLSNDVQPNRLDRVKLAIQDLIGQLQGDRVGLIAFAGRAFLQAPLTIDYDAVVEALNDLDTKTIPEGGTNISSAITLATQSFGKSAMGNRALVIFTDGEELSGDAVKTAKEAADAGVRIFTVGVGTPQGSLIPVTGDDGQTSFIKDSAGQVVKSKLDDKRLREIAQATGGFYLHLENGPRSMQQIQNEGLAKMQAAEMDVRLSRRPIERYEWPLGAALIALALSILIPERKRARQGASVGVPVRNAARGVAGATAVAALLMVFLSSSVFATAPGLDAYRSGKFEDAYGQFQQTLKTHPESRAEDKLQFDSGAAAYKLKDYSKAMESFSQALLSRDIGLQSKGHYNLGNTLYQRGETQKSDDKKLSDWTNALDHYEQTLKLDPQNKEAKDNYDYVKKKIEELKNKKQDQPSPTPSPQQKNKQDKQDKQNKQNKQDQQQKEKEQQQQQQQNQQQQQGQGQQQQKDQKQSQDQQSQGQSGNQKDQQEKNDQAQAKNEPQKNQQQQQPGETPSPSPGTDKQQGQQPSPSPGEQRGQESPSPGEGENETPSPSPGEGEEQNTAPSATPGESKKFAGEVKGAGGDNSQKPPDKNAQVAEAEPEKEGQMSERQAEALLESMKDEEARVQLDERRATRHVYKDW
jgi:Ca-activated chloride channel family protein